jgi:hypothetical protein
MSDLNIGATGGLAKYDTTGPEQKPDNRITAEDLKNILSVPEQKAALLADIAKEAIDADNKGQQSRAVELKIAYFDISNPSEKTLARIFTEEKIDRLMKQFLDTITTNKGRPYLPLENEKIRIPKKKEPFCLDASRIMNMP